MTRDGTLDTDSHLDLIIAHDIGRNLKTILIVNSRDDITIIFFMDSSLVFNLVSFIVMNLRSVTILRSN